MLPLQGTVTPRRGYQVGRAIRNDSDGPERPTAGRGYGDSSVLDSCLVAWTHSNSRSIGRRHATSGRRPLVEAAVAPSVGERLGLNVVRVVPDDERRCQRHHTASHAIDATATQGGAVADHLAVVQSECACGRHHGEGNPLRMPPPKPPALFPLTWLKLIVRTPLGGLVPGPALAFKIPPPDAVPPVPAAVLWFTSDQLIVIVPWFTMPAPLMVVAVLFSTSLPVMKALPPFAMPPAAIGGPVIGGGTGAVDVLPFTWLKKIVSCAGAGGWAARAASSTVAARDASTVEGGVAVHLAHVDRNVAGEVLDAAAPGIRCGVVVHLAEVERELAGGTGAKGGPHL